MKYQIIYTKTVPAIAWRDTLAESEALARQMTRYGYTVSVWEHTENGAREINSK